MKITRIETIPIRLPTRRVHQWASLTTPIGVYVIIKLHTDEGLIGLGETFFGARADREYREVADGAPANRAMPGNDFPVEPGRED